MSNFSLNLNKLHTSIQDLGIKNIKVVKTGHQVFFEGTTENNIKLKFKLNEACLGQTSPAAWSYSANPDNDLWVQRISFLQDIPEVIQDIINKKRFDSSYLNTINENKAEEETKEEETDKDSDKKEGHKYEYGCLMGDIESEDWSSDFVEEEDLFFDPEEDDDQFGREEDKHVTILFGFKQDETDMTDLDKFIEKIKPIDDLTITGISCFNSEKYDVLKYDIESEILSKLNTELREEFPYENDHPKYHAHMTIAYLLPGKGEKYDEKYEEPKKLESITKLTYSFPSGEKKTYTLKEDKEEK
jgi:2'-5' RNA ligase